MKGIVFGGGKFGYKNLQKTTTTSIKRAIYKIDVDEVFCAKKAGMHHTLPARESEREGR